MDNISVTNERPVILIVDDQIHNIEVLAISLEIQGYAITYALSGKDTFERLQAIKPDLILLDLFLPDMTGLEICEKIKADSHYQSIPILFLTASHEEEYLMEAFSKGASDYITKPFNTTQLLARVNTHIKLRQQTIELKKNKDKLNKIVNHIQNGIIMIDSAGVIQFTNPASAIMSSQSLSNLIGYSLEDV